LPGDNFFCYNIFSFDKKTFLFSFEFLGEFIFKKMAFVGRKKDKLKILEDIYHDNSQIKSDKIKIKEFFQDAKKTETLLSFGIVIIGLGAIILGLFQLQDKLAFRQPASKKVAANTDLDKDDLLGLKNKDTDQDGLSDYDELYVYKTSPYLQDSDSDGLEDKNEISSSHDPNCPEGQNCFGTWSDLTSADSETATTGAADIDTEKLRQILVSAGMSQAQVDALSDQSIIAAYEQILESSGATKTSASSGTNTTASVADQINSMSASQIRQLLLQQGSISQAELDKISDAELLQMVQDNLGATDSNAVASNQSSAGTTLEQINSMTPAQIRQLLQQQGSIPQATLDQVSDESLMQLVKETLAASKSSTQ